MADPSHDPEVVDSHDRPSSASYAAYPETPLASPPLAAPPPPKMQLTHRRPATITPVTSGAPSMDDLPRPRTVHTNLLRDPIPKPWLDRPDPWLRRARYLFMAISFLGVIGGAAQCYFGLKSVPKLGPICLILDEDFSSGTLDTSIWSYEVSVGGFGNGEFEWTTSDEKNSRIENGVLYLTPTLTEDALPGGAPAVFDGLNITIPGCTTVNASECIAVSNATAGTVINPVQSARISTRNSKSIRYGRVEVRAKMPTGDWLWPAIWMLPVNNTYGAWPRSGEIDIVESRGNGPDYPAQGTDWLSSALHWGPEPLLDAFWRTLGWWEDKHSTFDAAFHTYVLEWDEDFIWTYIDSRINRLLNERFKKPFFARGKFPTTVFNGTGEIVLTDPWGGARIAPFDQAFYLILDLAVGGTNGWFPDGKGGKPWVDASTTAMRDFARAKDVWYKTWPTDLNKRSFGIESVKMWQRC